MNEKTEGKIDAVKLNDGNRPAILTVNNTEYCSFDKNIQNQINTIKKGDRVELEFYTKKKNNYVDNYIVHIQLLESILTKETVKGKIQNIINSDGDRPDLLYVNGTKFLVPIKEKLVGLSQLHEVEVQWIETNGEYVATSIKCLGMTDDELANEPMSDATMYAQLKRMKRDIETQLTEYERRDKSLIR